MRKYWTLFKVNLVNSLEYRGFLIIWILTELVSLSSAIFLWMAVFRTNNMVGGYDRQKMLTYYLLLPTIGGFVSTFISERLPKMIKDGEISLDLLKPYSFAASMMLKNLGVKIVQQIFKIPIYVAVLYLGALIFDLHLAIWWLFAGITIAIFAYFLNFWLSYSLSMAAFWMDDIWALSLLNTVMLLIFGGLSFPIDIVPASYRWIFNILPFRLIYYFPVSVAQGKLNFSDVFIGLTHTAVWLLFFYLLGNVLWKRGLRKYGAYGQ